MVLTYMTGAGSSNEELEVLVYLSAREDANLLGSVFLKNETIEEAIKQIKEVSYLNYG